MQCAHIHRVVLQELAIFVVAHMLAGSILSAPSAYACDDDNRPGIYINSHWPIGLCLLHMHISVPTQWHCASERRRRYTIYIYIRQSLCIRCARPAPHSIDLNEIRIAIVCVFVCICAVDIGMALTRPMAPVKSGRCH